MSEEKDLKSQFRTAFHAGGDAFRNMPRWTFYLIVVGAVFFEKIVRDWLVSRYSIPRFEAILFSFLPIILFAWVVVLFSKRR